MSIKEKVIALGFFDGVHLGHAALLRRTVEEAKARGATPAVFTFDRPPKEVITGKPCPLINSPEDRRDLVRRLFGIREVIMVPFDHEMMTTPWDDFVTNILVRRYHAVHLVAGHDHHFGHKNEGSPERLQEKCKELGLGCDIIPKVEMSGTIVSSTYIRRLVELGQIERANCFLGHPQPAHPAPRSGPQSRRICHPGHSGRRHILPCRHQCGHPPHRQQRHRCDRGGLSAGLPGRSLRPHAAAGVLPPPAGRGPV